MLLMVYNSLILPYLMYCIEIWGNTYEHRLRDLVLLQKRAVRIIDNVGYRDHTSTIFKKFRLLKLIDIVHYQTYILMFKAYRGNLPVKIQTKFQKKIKTFICIIQGLRITFLQGKTQLELVKCQ